MSEEPAGSKQTGRVLPPVFFLVALLVMAALHFFAPVLQVSEDPWRYLGLVPLSFGTGLIFVSAYYFKRAGTAMKPFEKSTALVMKGPYRLTRNPMYLGLILILVGMAVLLGSLTPYLVIFVFIYLIRRKFVLPEESMLHQTFGERYEEYLRKVRRWM
jgi:protein-S-isoprenylcysteine O-methyltransferase Ste14